MITIGQQVNLVGGTAVYHGKSYPTYKLDDPEFMDVVALTYPGKVRIMIPGGIYTQDMRFDRTNIHINEAGIVTNITNG